MYEFLDASVDEIVAKCAEVKGKPVIIHNEEVSLQFHNLVDKELFSTRHIGRSVWARTTFSWVNI